MSRGEIVSRRRQRQDDGDDSLSDAPSSSAGSQSSKRQKLTYDALPEDSDDHPVLPTGYLSEQEVHQPGSIVRIKVKNFVTYTAAEFKCGPSLNMIIGPNGTGKSTLVCAICLGLGWKTSVLGRAKEISEYVKRGSREAEIEIELAAGTQHNGRNSIIRHVIKREGNKSTWFLNGSSTTHKAIMDLVRSFHIQIDNLCQFLPQDRVVEFAQMSPVQLLESTQKAAAPEQMSLWHNELKKLGVKRKDHLANQEGSQAKLQQLQTSQNAQRADVERMAERKALLLKVKALKKCRPAVKYRAEAVRHQVMKERRKEAQKELNALQREVDPSLASVTAKKEYKAQLEGVVQFRKTMVDRFESQTKVKAGKLDDLKEKIGDCDKSLDVDAERHKKTKTEMQRINAGITKLKAQQQAAPPEFDSRSFNEDIREEAGKCREIKAKVEQLDERLSELDSTQKRKADERTQFQGSLQGLKSQSGQQLGKLSGQSRDAAKAWQWLQKNQTIFKDKVYGPPIVECSVTDLKYANAVESLLGPGDFQAFTVTNSDDWRLLQTKLIDELGLPDINVRRSTTGMEHWRQQYPMEQQQLGELGLDGWAIDYVQGPEAVLSMLCDSVRLHKTAVSLRTGNEQQFERLKESPIQTWVSGKQKYSIKKRQVYGPAAISTSVDTIKNARYWTGSAVDTDAQNNILRQIREVETDLGAIDEQREQLKQERTELNSEAKQADERRKALEEKKSDLQKLHNDFKVLPTKIATQEEKLASLIDSRKQYDKRKRETIVEKNTFTLERGQEAINYAIAVAQFRKFHVELFEAEIRLIEAESDLQIVEDRSSAVREMLAARVREVKQLDDAEKTQKRVCLTLLDESRKVQEDVAGRMAGDGEADEENMTEAQIEAHAENDIYVDYCTNVEITPDALEAEIETASHRVELLHEGNPHALQQYEARQKKIDELARDIEKFQETFSALNESIKRIREQWEPKLDSLVAEISDAFSHNFEKIGCAGQVGMHKDEEDFNAWAVQIQVKFRENEELSILDSHRQSGGERAVSTIFYLMALQSLARSPFRVVDEINQGMDPRNERLVHERMVDIACSENTSQYFLITPKLLNGLKYHGRMAVHTIFSGETMPEDNNGLDLRRQADLALKVAGKVN